MLRTTGEKGLRKFQFLPIFTTHGNVPTVGIVSKCNESSHISASHLNCTQGAIKMHAYGSLQWPHFYERIDLWSSGDVDSHTSLAFFCVMKNAHFLMAHSAFFLLFSGQKVHLAMRNGSDAEKHFFVLAR